MSDQEHIRELQAKLIAAQSAACRMREALQRVFDEIEGDDCGEECTAELCPWMNASNALSASAPCPHEAEVKRLREALIALRDSCGAFGVYDIIELVKAMALVRAVLSAEGREA